MGAPRRASLSLKIAEDSWLEFFEPMFGPVEPIVDAILALPEDQVVIEAVPRPPIVFHMREGVVRGQRFRIIGTRPGGEWAEIIEVAPV